MDIIKTNKKKSIFIIMTIILGLGITLGAVYFMYYYKDSRENNLNTGLVSIGFAEGSGTVNLTGEVPVVDDVGLEKTPYTFTVTNTSSIPIDAKIKLKINSLSTNIDLSAVRYGVFINSELVKKDYIHEDDLVLYTNELMTPNETINCKLVFWIDYYYEQSNKTFSATIVAEGVSRDIINGALVSFDANGGVVSPKIKTMNKTTTTYGELPTPTKEGYAFLGWYTDPTNGNEITSSTTYTFGTSATTLYAHWEKEPFRGTATTMKNNYTTLGLDNLGDAYRYVGSSPDNYVLFNCTNDSDPSTCEEWRIIGVYTDATKGDMLKIVRGTPSTTSQKYRSSGNAWNGSDIQSYLVNTYYPTLSTTAKGMIEESATWKVGAAAYDANAGAAYTSAGGTTWTGKIGLVASYEYMYAAGSSCQNTSGNSYHSGSPSCGSQDWLWPVLTNNKSSYGWFMSPNSDGASYALRVSYSSGLVNNDHANNTYAASPTVYLKSTINITGGNGKSGVANAYRLG